MIRRIGILFCVLLLAGCENAVESQLERELWQDLGIRSYQFEYMVSCFCGFTEPNPALITVQNGAVVKVEPADGGPAVTGSLEDWPTIDDLFSIISHASEGDPDVLDVEYDETYHYPTIIHIDPIERAADDEITYRVQRFTPLSPTQ
jgi:hypothetical protein